MIYKFHNLQDCALWTQQAREELFKGKWSQKGERERAAAVVPRTQEALPSAAPAVSGDPRPNPG